MRGQLLDRKGYAVASSKDPLHALQTHNTIKIQCASSGQEGGFCDTGAGVLQDYSSHYVGTLQALKMVSDRYSRNY